MNQKHNGMSTSSRTRPRRADLSSRGFTLVELLVAIVVLLAVIIGLSRIFSTATQVTRIGQATATVLQEAAVIEKRLREDIANLSTDGFFAIRQVAVRNDVHGIDELLDTSKPPGAIVRADQLVFFSEKAATVQAARHGDAGLNIFAQSNAARVYWGHGVQLPDGPEFEPGGAAQGFAIDPGNNLSQEPLVPWRRGAIEMRRTLFSSATAAGPTGTNIYNRNAVEGNIDATQPTPRRWLLSRQAVLLADTTPQNEPLNNNRKTRIAAELQGFNPVPAARSIFSDIAYGPNSEHPRFGWSRELRHGRFDAATSTLADIRRWMRVNPFTGATDNSRPWVDFLNSIPIGQGGDQRTIIGREVLFYPRAERRAPSMLRPDQALTNHVIGSAVSNFIVEWTWEDGVGDRFDSEGNRLFYLLSDSTVVRSEPEIAGAIGSPSELDFNPEWWPFGFYTNWYIPGGSPPYEFQPRQPWFGINRSSWFCPDCPDRGVGFYSDVPFDDSSYMDSYQVRANFKPADTVFPNFISGTLDDRTIEWWGDASDFAARYSGLDNWSTYEDRVLIYEAFFGFNRDTPVGPNPFDAVNAVEPYPELAYTPWPSAIRVTMTLHDPQGRLENGREFQFVIELPRRVRQPANR